MSKQCSVLSNKSTKDTAEIVNMAILIFPANIFILTIDFEITENFSAEINIHNKKPEIYNIRFHVINHLNTGSV